MKVWFDEDLSPTLVAVANQCGVLATCETTADFMVNKLVRIDEHGTCTAETLPAG